MHPIGLAPYFSREKFHATAVDFGVTEAKKHSYESREKPMADEKRSDPPAITIDPRPEQVSGFIAETDAVFARLSAFVDEYQDAKVDRLVSGVVHLTRDVNRVSDVAVGLVELSDALIDAKAQLFRCDVADIARQRADKDRTAHNDAVSAGLREQFANLNAKLGRR